MFLLEQKHFASTYIIFPTLSHYCQPVNHCCYSFIFRKTWSLHNYYSSWNLKNMFTCTHKEKINLN